MRKKFKCDIDCAMCASELEESLRSVKGVDYASVNFIMQKLTLEASDDIFDEVLRQVIEKAKKDVPDCEIFV